MKYLDLKEPSASCTLKVERIDRRKSNFGEDYALIGIIEHGEQASVSVPEKAMERQMANTLKISDADDLKGRFVTVSRSDKPGTNGKLFWNVVWASEQAYEGPTPKAAPKEESKRIQPPAEDYAKELKNDPQGVQAGAAQPVAKEPAPSKAPAQLPLGGAAGDAHYIDEAQRIADNVEAKKRAGMVEIRNKYRALWESEAEFQILAVMRVREKIAKERQLALDDVPQIVVDGSSVNAESATLWINFDRRNYV